jgi:hypothetical protein
VHRELTPDRLDEDGRDRAYKSCENYAEIRSEQIFSSGVEIDGAERHVLAALLEYIQIGSF